MNRKVFTRVVAVILAIIMAGSVLAVAFQAFAMGPVPMMIANTGDTDTKNTVVILAVVAFVIMVVLVVLPAILKKKK